MNRKIHAIFRRLKDSSAARRSHCVAGRFENIYIHRGRIPEVEPVLESALGYAAEILGSQPLKAGFWFNAMTPGQATSLHTHDEADELLSGVYYVAAPRRSGDLILHRGERHYRVTPRAGRLVLFPPAIPHAVEPNASAHMRLAIAFNIGPLD